MTAGCRNPTWNDSSSENTLARASAEQPRMPREAGAPAPGMRGFSRGRTHGGVRWKRCRRPTSGWISGTNWMAEAPVPTTAT